MTPSTELHAITRAMEHYGVALTRGELEILNRECRDGQSVLLKANSNGAEIRIVRHGEIAMVAVYDPKLNRIKTFLYRDAVTSKRCRYWASAGKSKTTSAAKQNSGHRYRSGHRAKRDRRPDYRPRMEMDGP